MMVIQWYWCLGQVCFGKDLGVIGGMPGGQNEYTLSCAQLFLPLQLLKRDRLSLISVSTYRWIDRSIGAHKKTSEIQAQRSWWLGRLKPLSRRSKRPFPTFSHFFKAATGNFFYKDVKPKSPFIGHPSDTSRRHASGWLSCAFLCRVCSFLHCELHAGQKIA